MFFNIKLMFYYANSYLSTRKQYPNNYKALK